MQSAGYTTKEILHGDTPTLSGLSASALTGFASSIAGDVFSAAFDGHLGNLLRGSTPMPQSHRLYLNGLEEFIDKWGGASYIVGTEIARGLIGDKTEKEFDQIQ